MNKLLFDFNNEELPAESAVSPSFEERHAEEHNRLLNEPQYKKLIFDKKFPPTYGLQ